jgi:transposase
VKDTALYQQLLGIEAPWRVVEVKLDVKAQQVDVWVEHRGGTKFACPECGIACGVYDHTEERSWRHLDSCQFKTMLHARTPRVRCDEHGVKQVRVPWAEPSSRFTLLFERLVIDVLREASVEATARLLGMSWDEVWRVKGRAVERGLARKVPKPLTRIGVDEKATRKGHRYMTLVFDLESGTVEHIVDGRRKEGLERFYESLPENHRTSIQAVAMDMWEPFVRATEDALPDAAIVFDRFHIMKHMNEAVDRVRRAEHRHLRNWGLDTLTGTKHLWLYARENLPERHRDSFQELRKTSLKTGRAWAIKEDLRFLWECTSKDTARRFWKQWDGWARRCRLPAVVGVARMIRSHLDNILTYFDHPITNGLAEGVNSVIQTIKRTARGFRNDVNFKTAVLFRCGGLDLYPRPQETHRLPG